MTALSSAANRVTLVRIVLIPVFLVILLAELPVWGPWLAAVVFALLASTDAVDGYLARSRNEVTTFGKFIDPLADKLLVTAALVALVDLERLPSWIALVIISRELVVSGLRMVAVAEGRVIAASMWGKVKTVLQIVAIVGFIVMDSSVIPDVFGAGTATAFRWLVWAVMIAALIATVVSMIDYFYHARDIITGPWSKGQRDA
ncbi:MAG: CDP-diacylglycerol--glycerol-3-phosphate 3-phosphatidyltransferase [Coriobacteriales bacterium]|nr:CDP-diacylglycerol--glycerol-3-phosphate 3-phosphatidyltransferase [Actinomycetes bacterium]